MNANLDTKTVARNAVKDSLQDGLMELGLGAYLLLTGIAIQADMSSLFILLIIFFPPLLKRAKERFTYPRIGYVKFTEADRSAGRKVLAALVAAVFAIALAVFLSSTDERTQALYKWVPLLPALLFQAVLIPTGRRSGLIRFYEMAALALAVGLVIPFVDLPRKLDNIALYFMVMGPILLLWGTVIFANFLRTYPVRTEEAQ